MMGTPDARRERGPGRSQIAVSARHAPQVVRRRREERGGPGQEEPVLLEVTLPRPRVPRPPVPSSLPTRGMTPKPEPPCARNLVGGRAPPTPPRHRHPGRTPRVEGTAGTGTRGSPHLGRQVRRRRAGRRVRGALGRGRGPGSGGRVRAPGRGRGRAVVSGAGGRAAGPAGDDGGGARGREAISSRRPWGSPNGLLPAATAAARVGPPGGPDAKPGHRLADAARRSAGAGGGQRPGAGRARGPERRGLGGRAALASCAYKSGAARAGGAAPAAAAPLRSGS